MNYFFVFAGIILFLALFVHVLGGDKEYRSLRPDPDGSDQDQSFTFWLMGRCVFHIASVDLLLTAIFLLLLGIGLIPFNFYLSLFIALLYAGYLLAWLLTIAVSQARPKSFLYLGQWILFLIVLLLIGFGMTTNV